jgi:glycine/D-amino acid oxidase-like deaminating enzyme
VPGYGHRYWAERTLGSRRPAYPSFRGSGTADVVVVGGGLTGCTAAYMLAAAGLDVVLLDASRLTSGATSASLGAVVPQPDAAFRQAERAAGIRGARAAWQAARRGAHDLASALRRLRIRCDLAAAPVIVEASGPEVAASLRREQAARKAAGLDAPWVAPAALARETGRETPGALRLADGFLIDPVRAALGLARAAESKGARIYERSPVRTTTFTRKDATVRLASGAIRTKQIFVATGGPGPLFAQLRRHVRAQDGFVVVTEPLDAAMRRATGTRTPIVTEAGEAAHWLRWLSEDRALFAGALSSPVPIRQEPKTLVARTGQLMYELSLRYEAISGLPARWSWKLPVITTPDGLPWIGPHRNYPFHFFAMGFGWHGDAFAWVAAKTALRHFRGETTREDRLLGFERHL